MRLLFLMAILAFSGELSAQTTPFYLACNTTDFSDKKLTVKVIYAGHTGDSLTLSPSPDDMTYSALYRKTSDIYLKRLKAYEDPAYNIAWIGGGRLLLIQGDGNYCYYLTDQQRAVAMHDTYNPQEPLVLRDSLKVAYEAAFKKNKEANALRNTAVLTAYAHNLKSIRSDPELEKLIKKWSNNPTTQVYIVDQSYQYTRNGYGVVLNEYITVVFKFKLNGKCFIQWRAFGHDALGGGQFSPDLGIYGIRNSFVKAKSSQGWVDMDPATNYEISCD